MLHTPVEEDNSVIYTIVSLEVKCIQNVSFTMQETTEYLINIFFIIPPLWSQKKLLYTSVSPEMNKNYFDKTISPCYGWIWFVPKKIVLKLDPR